VQSVYNYSSATVNHNMICVAAVHRSVHDLFKWSA